MIKKEIRKLVVTIGAEEIIDREIERKADRMMRIIKWRSTQE